LFRRYDHFAYPACDAVEADAPEVPVTPVMSDDGAVQP
jgi:hypothetical protein